MQLLLKRWPSKSCAGAGPRVPGPQGPGEGAGQRRPTGWGRGGARGKPGVGEGLWGAGSGGVQRKKEGGGTGRGGVVFAPSAHSYHSLELGHPQEEAKGRGEEVT